MRVLVTGGAGFIGSHLCDALVREGHELTIIDNLSTGRRENVLDAESLVEADIRDRSALQTALERSRPEIVFHLAAQMNVRRSVADALQDAEINILGGLNIFQAAVHAGVGRMIFASSGGAIYGDQEHYPCTEGDYPKPSSPYAITKLAVEQYGRFYRETAGLEFTALRLANVYGPRQNPQGEAGVVALFMKDIRASKAPTIFGDGGQTRDFVWIGDVVRAFLLSMKGREGTYNIGTGKETTIRELHATLSRIMKPAPKPRHSPTCAGEVRRNSLSCKEARQVLGWRPTVTLVEGLKRTATSAAEVA